ncbi:MAG: hypothetical protein ABFD94_13230 [Armatimonadia bacterium]
MTRGLGFVYTVHCQDPEAELAAAEAWAFTGAEMVGRVVYAPWGVDVARSAYLRHCVHIETQGETLEGLVEDCKATGVAYERFKITLLRPPPKVPERADEVVLRVANAVTGKPDLTAPQVELAVVATQGRWMMGRLISVGLNRWLEGIERPIHFSSALPQRFSRALVNLVASPGDTLIDPCCGIGTPLIEATEAGMFAFGADYNVKMLRGLAQNLKHLGMPLRLFRADARQLVGHWDAAVVDLPYGRNLLLDKDLARDILLALRGAAKRVAVVSAGPLEEVLGETAYEVVRKAIVPKGALKRHVYVVRVKGERE